jgi:cholest-4-en-3-one 26-monooxygenase
MVSQSHEPEPERAVGVPAVDLTDPATFRDGPPHGFFARMRRECPVWWHDRPDAPGFWVVTRYDDVVDVIGRPDVFVNRWGVTIDPNEPAGAGADEPERGQGALSYTDPPWHRPLRRVLSPHFTPGRMRALEDVVRAHAERLVDRFAAQGGGDFVADVAYPYPLRVLSAVLGLPTETADALFRFVGESDGASQEARALATQQFLEAAGALAAERRRRPGDDLVSAMVSGSGEGAQLAAARFGGIVIQLAIAGNETTRAALSQGVRLLAERPELGDAIRADRSFAAAMVEEVLRYRSPVHYTRRTVAAAGEGGDGATIAGRPVNPGDIVYLALASANRDETVFEHPDRFDPTRRFERAHLGLGIGEHFCLGAALARLELRCMFETVAERVTGLEPANEPSPHRSAMFDGLSRLPLRCRV